MHAKMAQYYKKNREKICAKAYYNKYKNKHRKKASKFTCKFEMSSKDANFHRHNENQINNSDYRISMTRLCRIEDGCPDSAQKLEYAKRLHNNLSDLSPNLTIAQMRKKLDSFQSCKGMHSDRIYCCGQSDCTDKLALLKLLSPHSQHLRTVIRKIYRLLSIGTWLNKYDIAILEGDWSIYSELIYQVSRDATISDLYNESFSNENEFHTEVYVTTKYANL